MIRDTNNSVHSDSKFHILFYIILSWRNFIERMDLLGHAVA
jgi:hypothetical protein